MKLLFDQNLSHQLARDLQSAFPGSTHVRSLGLAAADDDAVWEYARQNEFTIVTKDTDFEERATRLGHPPKVIQIELGNVSTEAVLNLIQAYHDLIQLFESDTESSILILP